MYSANENILKYRSMTGSGFPDDTRGVYQFENASVLNAYDTFTKRTGISQMVRANYAYHSRYLFTFTMRRDGDSVFGKGNKYGIFPSVALGWNMEQEEFFRGWDFLDRSKLRISYSKNGNQDILSYSTLATMQEQYYLDSEGNPLPGFYPNKLADTSLTWEKTRQWNAGWDYSFLKGRISGSFDLFYTSTYDLLLDKTIPDINGVTSIRQNVGRTKSNGIEIGLSTQNIRTRNFEWNTDLTIAHSKNRIVHVGLYDENGKPADNVANKWFIGKSIHAVYGYKFDGIWQEGDDIANSHMPDARPGDIKVLDYDGDGAITPEDRHVFGSEDPKVTAGLMNTFHYKGITLSIFMYGSAGATRFTEYNNPYFEKWNIRDRAWWTPENPINTYPANRSDTNPYGVSIFGKGNNASFIRIADISLGYSFPEKLLKPVGIKRLVLFGNIKNPFLFTGYVGLDPEYKQDYNAPASRSFIFGIKLGI
ncbi:MAG: SusC/RagA family TonB-linked outer membrane protein [Bacteroides sp.]|nr:SusC/RagA family TonB-linked outer membrane protein [Bacteroides sp.]